MRRGKAAGEPSSAKVQEAQRSPPPALQETGAQRTPSCPRPQGAAHLHTMMLALSCSAEQPLLLCSLCTSLGIRWCLVRAMLRSHMAQPAGAGAGARRMPVRGCCTPSSSKEASAAGARRHQPQGQGGISRSSKEASAAAARRHQQQGQGGISRRAKEAAARRQICMTCSKTLALSFLQRLA
jgi:hypothetical protein